MECGYTLISILIILISLSIPIVTLVFVIKTYNKVKNIEKNISGQ
ncbi:MAG: hypothetical protein ABIF11_06450 [Nitrospirota bacterium]